MKEVIEANIIKNIQNWIVYVSETKTSNNWNICPYAKNATASRVRIYEFNPNLVEHTVNLFLEDKQRFKVWVFICSPLDNVEELAKTLNHQNTQTVWLWDTAELSGEIDGTKTGNGIYNLLLLQDKLELNAMSQNLQDKGYYSNWSQSYFDQIVSWRKND
jgi:hypothetical protein